MIPFNKPYCSGLELKYIEQVCHSTTMSGNGQFTKKCHAFFEEKYSFKKCLLTTSGTDALEMCAMLCDLKPGDEVIIPSYTFVSTALAFLREGAKVVFADSGKEGPNCEAENIEPLIIENDRMRDASYKNAIKSSDLVQWIKIIKTLLIRKKEREEAGKKITATDERYLKLAEEGLYSELALATGRDKEEIQEIILSNCG